MVMQAEDLSDSRVLHYVVSGVLGLFTVVILLIMAFNNAMRRVSGMGGLSGWATLVGSTAVLLAYKRFSEEGPVVAFLTVLGLLWGHKPWGRAVVVASVASGMALTRIFQWYQEYEDDARRRGVLAWLLNGRAAIRRVVCCLGYYCLFQAFPNPDYAIVVSLLFFLRDWVEFGFRRMHIYLHSRTVSPVYHTAVPDDYTERQLRSLREHIKANPGLLNSVRSYDNTRRFIDGMEHVRPEEREEWTAWTKRRGCSIM
jgi:hypothetical protein